MFTPTLIFSLRLSVDLLSTENQWRKQCICSKGHLFRRFFVSLDESKKSLENVDAHSFLNLGLHCIVDRRDNDYYMRSTIAQ